MDYSKLVSVTGLPGLFELVASKNDGAIVRALEDKSTRFVSSRVHNFSHLESIEVYTEGDNVNLVDVFHAMQESGETLPDEKDNNAVKTYFKKAYPTMDFDRVYASDMKKMIKWFDVLKKNDIEIKLREEEPEEDEEVNNDEQQKDPNTQPEVKPKVEEPEEDEEVNNDEQQKDPNTQPEVKPKVEEPVDAPAVEGTEPKKAKVAKAKKAEAVPDAEDAPLETDTKAAKRKTTKK